MLEWADVWKVVLGFASSMVLIWIKELLVHRRKLKGMRKTLWSMMEFESDLEEFLGALDRIRTSVAEGKLRLVAFDIPEGITSAAEELARLEPKSAYVYNDLQSHAEIVRNGISSLRDFIKHLAVSTAESSNEQRLRNVIVGQASILKGDRLNLGQAELRLMRHLKDNDAGLNQSTVDKLETALAKFQKDDYAKIFDVVAEEAR